MCKNQPQPVKMAQMKRVQGSYKARPRKHYRMWDFLVEVFLVPLARTCFESLLWFPTTLGSIQWTSVDRCQRCPRKVCDDVGRLKYIEKRETPTLFMAELQL